MRLTCALAASLLLASGSPARPTPSNNKAGQAAQSVAPSAQAVAVVDAFHAALRSGDSRAAQSILAADVLVFEAGGVERGRQEYGALHLAADSAFARAVPAKLVRRTAHAAGDIAWVATEGRTTGIYKGKPLDRITAETMILRRIAGAWKIVHIHWSSAAGAK